MRTGILEEAIRVLSGQTGDKMIFLWLAFVFQESETQKNYLAFWHIILKFDPFDDIFCFPQCSVDFVKSVLSNK